MENIQEENFRKITFAAIVQNCLDVITRMHHDVSTGKTQTLTVKVWPNFAPPEEGMLINLD